MRTIEERKISLEPFLELQVFNLKLEAAAVRPLLWMTADAEDWKGDT
jgi:hypothetical protein